MKLIVLDCLRRWAWFYLVGFIFAVAIDIAAAWVPSLGVFTPYFLAPMVGPLFVLGFDLMRGAAGVTIGLPISAKKVGVGYWIVGVCIPPVLLTLALTFAAIIVQPFNPPMPAWSQVGPTFLISLLIGGCIFCILTFFRTGPQEGIWNNVTAGLAGALWGVSAFSSMGVKFLLDAREGDTLMMVILMCVALSLSVVGFLRGGEMVRLRARNRVVSEGKVRKAASTAEARSGIGGLQLMFLESIKFALATAAILLLIGAILWRVLQVNAMFVHYTLVFCAVLPSLRYFGSLRQMRTLPISVDGLAFILFILPLVNFSLCLGMLLLAQGVTGAAMLNVLPVALLLTAVLASLGNCLAVRFGPKSLPFIFGLGMALLFLLQIEFLRSVPPGVVVAGSAMLMILAYAILRRSLGSSSVYRLPTAGLAMG
jgi:hypothetical protein